MPRYYFHVLNGTSMPDLEGTVLPDVDAARHEAVRLCAGILGETQKGFWKGEVWRLEVHDDTDALLFTLSFSGRDAAIMK